MRGSGRVLMMNASDLHLHVRVQAQLDSTYMEKESYRFRGRID